MRIEKTQTCRHIIFVDFNVRRRGIIRQFTGGLTDERNRGSRGCARIKKAHRASPISMPSALSVVKNTRGRAYDSMITLPTSSFPSCIILIAFSTSSSGK